MSLREYLELWIDTYVKPFRRSNTVACYRRAVKSLPPELVAHDLGEVDPLRIQGALNNQAMQYPRAAQLTYATLHAAFVRAVKLGYCRTNPVDACEKPKHEAKRATVLTRDQLHVYLDHARRVDRWSLLLLMVCCGLRRGEALGVMWQDIDGDTLHIRRQRITGKEAPLKSRSSRRDVPLPAPVRQEIAKLPRPIGGGWICDCSATALQHDHNAVIRAARLPHCTLHGLRHSCATSMAEDGTPIKLLQAMLGHSHYQLTADLYADHVRATAYSADMERYCNAIF